MIQAKRTGASFGVHESNPLIGMTASTLLTCIGVCLLAQLSLGILLALRKRAATVKVGSAQPVMPAKERLNAAWSGLRAFKVVQRTYEDPAQTQCSFYLQPVDGAALPDFKPGQYLTFSLQVPGNGDAELQQVTRCYSLSDAPASGHYRVTIKRVPAPPGKPDVPAGVSSNYFHDRVQVGDTLQLRAPAGHFYIDAESHTPVVLIAGGIGITPMMSMLRWCLQHQPQREVHLFYGLRNGHEHAYKEALVAMAAQTPNVHLHVVYSRPLPGDRLQVDYQHQGHVDIALLKQQLPHGAHQFYLCGPGAMMESLVPALSQWGVATQDIHFEAFGPASVRLPQDPSIKQEQAPVQPVEVHFQRSGRTLQWTGHESSLLDFAEMHGIVVASGCRSGSCGSCVTAVADGSVHYDTAPDFDLEGGQCLLCVGKPATALTLDA
jgi:uncharacterized protein